MKWPRHLKIGKEKNNGKANTISWLNEVVVIGYGTMDKKELTSAISHVGEKDFLTISSLDPSMMIQGKVAGVSITNTGAGDPNNQASIQIRGVSSRSAGLGPLVVIDGERVCCVVKPVRLTPSSQS